MSMMRELVRFYGKDAAVTEDELKLASAAKGLSEEREATAAMAKAEDRVDIQEHIRRFHGGKLEPGESCPFLEKLKKAEEDFGTLDPKDADGDGNPDFAKEEEKEESEAEVSEDVVASDTDIKRRLRNVVARKNPDFDDAAIEEYIASLEK